MIVGVGCAPTAPADVPAPTASEWPVVNSLSSGPLSVEVAPETGGRIAGFSYEGQQVLRTERDSANLQWGSTVWLSPQEAWGWPPHPTFDQAAYDITRPDSNVLEMTSAVDPATQLQLTKRLRLEPEALYLTFQLHNRGDTVRQYGLWSNTRLPYEGGIVYVPGAQSRVTGMRDPVVKGQGMAVVRFDGRNAETGKIFTELADGNVRYLIGDLQFLQQTPYRTNDQVAPGQSPLEVYLAPDEDFAEFELQGPYGAILPGGVPLTFELVWAIAPLPGIN